MQNIIPPSWTFQDVANLVAQLRAEADRAARLGHDVAHYERNIVGLIDAAHKRWGKSPA